MRHFILGCMAVAVLFFTTIALADRQQTARSSGAAIDHGDWKRLSDGGFAYTVCGAAVNSVDGGEALVEAPCIPCEPGAWNAAPATCVAAWKARNTD